MLLRMAGIPFVAGQRVAGPARLGTGGEPMHEFGELAALVGEAAVTDVFIAAGRAWVDRGAGAVPTCRWCGTEAELDRRWFLSAG